jgi:hypothetical protein
MGIIFASVVLVAALTWIARRVISRRRREQVRARPGSSVETAIPIRAFDAMDAVVRERRCHCGERLRQTGEGSREVGPQRYRFARLACDECEEASIVYFDVTDILH